MGSRHHWIDGTPAFERAAAESERAQALAEQAYLAAPTGPSPDAIARSWELWTDYVDPLGTMTRDEFDALLLEDRLAIIAEVGQ